MLRNFLYTSWTHHFYFYFIILRYMFSFIFILKIFSMVVLDNLDNCDHAFQGCGKRYHIFF